MTTTTAQNILTSKEILDSFTVGQGKTNDLDLNSKVSDKIALHGLTVRYQGLDLMFQSEAHKQAYFLSIFYRNLKDLSLDNVDKLFKHLNSGNYLSLNHRDIKQADTSLFDTYKVLFESINMVTFERVSPKSKLYTLSYKVSLENNKVLINSGFKIHSPIVDNSTFQVVGFTVELPVKD